ncbi:MAG: DUF302 domain-containing protein [Sneathiella sp.]|nr:DUF302 domain-containing protein [Sneathiella sp.]
MQTLKSGRRINRNWIPVIALGIAVMMSVFSLSAQARGALQTYQSDQKFEEFLERLKQAIASEKMGIVAEACADCGARAIGVTIPGNRVVMIFHPRFAVRMLKASVDAGIEAPLRLYVTERSQGTQLSFYKASDVFAPYASTGDLVEMAKELDDILVRIAEQAIR